MRTLFLSFCLLCVLLTGCARPDGGEVNWVTMGTVAAVKWNDSKAFPVGRQAPLTIKESFSRIEKLLNAHDPQSELSRLAPLPDAEILAKCSDAVRPCYEAAFRLRDQTDGVFNPRWKGHGTMDLGAIAKGFAVDEALSAINLRQPTGDASSWRILVDLGGNLKAIGTKGWKVGIKDGDSFMLEPGQACATSGEYFRGKHIKDGRSGAEVTNAVYSVTVIHPNSAMLADGLSTTLFILGREKGEAFIKRYYPEARVIWLSSGCL